MAEMSKAYTPEFMGDPNPREKILKLARKITDCVDHKILWERFRSCLMNRRFRNPELFFTIRFMMKTQAITLRWGQPIRSTFKAEEKCRMKNCWNTASTSARRTLISWSDPLR